MKTSLAHPKKSPPSKVRRKSPERGCVRRTSRSTSSRQDASSSSARPRRITAALRRDFRAWRASLPTALERDTLLMPDAIAESVVQEVERFLEARLPDDFAERLAAKTHYLYPRHRHFHKVLNRPGNRGRNNLYVYMRHWTAGWLKREHSTLYKKLPWSFGQGWPLPVMPRPASGRITRH